MRRVQIIIIFIIFTFISSHAQSRSAESENYSESENQIIAGIVNTHLDRNIDSEDLATKNYARNSISPVIKILKTSKIERQRILAAILLFKLGDSRGLFAIKRASQFDKSEKVKKVCSTFYSMFQKRHNLQ